MNETEHEWMVLAIDVLDKLGSCALTWQNGAPTCPMCRRRARFQRGKLDRNWTVDVQHEEHCQLVNLPEKGRLLLMKKTKMGDPGTMNEYADVAKLDALLDFGSKETSRTDEVAEPASEAAAPERPWRHPNTCDSCGGDLVGFEHRWACLDCGRHGGTGQAVKP